MFRKIYLFMFVALIFSRSSGSKKHKDYNEDRITLKINNDNKYLGVNKDDKVALVDYRNALFIKLNTMDNISKKTIEGNNNTALTEKGFWFFGRKNYKFTEISGSNSQKFRIVYYGPNEYLLMKDDSCLGWENPVKFKKMNCKLGSAAIFNICYGKHCGGSMSILKRLDHLIRYFKNIQRDNDNHNGSNMYDNGSNMYDNGSNMYDNGSNMYDNGNGRRPKANINQDSCDSEFDSDSSYGHSQSDHHINDNITPRGRHIPYNYDRKNFSDHNSSYSYSHDDNHKYGLNQPRRYPRKHDYNGQGYPEYNSLNDYSNRPYYQNDIAMMGCKDYSFKDSPFNQEYNDGLQDIFNGAHLLNGSSNTDINSLHC